MRNYERTIRSCDDRILVVPEIAPSATILVARFEDLGETLLAAACVVVGVRLLRCHTNNAIRQARTPATTLRECVLPDTNDYVSKM
jgi:hypothetical protein